MEWASVGVIVAVLAGQTVWIQHALGEVGKRLDRLDARLDRMEAETLREHGERIAGWRRARDEQSAAASHADDDNTAGRHPCQWSRRPGNAACAGPPVATIGLPT